MTRSLVSEEVLHWNLLTGVWTPGKVIYVDSSGSDSNSGFLPTEPLLKINAAMDKCTASQGDVIQVLGNSPSDPNDTATITCDVAGVTIRGLLGRGMLSDSGFGSPTQNVPTLSISANYVTVENLYLGSNASGNTNGIIDFTGSAWGCTIRNILFDTQNAVAYGVWSSSGHDLPYLLIEDCIFGRSDVASFTTNCIYLGNATGGMIRRNIFQRPSGKAIELHPGAANITILDNRFALRADASDGYAITLNAGTGNCYIDGNRAHCGETVMSQNPFLDESGADVNDWGLNYKGILATFPA